MRTPTRPPLRSSNPALREETFTATRLDGGGTMTVQGTVNKTALLLVLALATATASWVVGTAGGPGVTGWALGASLVGRFGVRVPLLNDASPLGILISLAIVVVAALNLVLDFDLIDRGARSGAPAYMEWYAAFGLLVTLVWLYLELLRLLAKLRER